MSWKDRLTTAHRRYQSLKTALEAEALQTGGCPDMWFVRRSFKEPEFQLAKSHSEMKARLCERWLKILKTQQRRRRVQPSAALVAALKKRHMSIRACVRCLKNESKEIALKYIQALEQECGYAWERLVLLVLLQRSTATTREKFLLGVSQAEGVPLTLPSGSSLYLWYQPKKLRPVGLSGDAPITGIRPDILLLNAPHKRPGLGKLPRRASAVLLECKSHSFKPRDFYTLWGQVRHLDARAGVLLPWATRIADSATSHDILSVQDQGSRLSALASPRLVQVSQETQQLQWRPWYQELLAIVEAAAAGTTTSA